MEKGSSFKFMIYGKGKGTHNKNSLLWNNAKNNSKMNITLRKQDLIFLKRQLSYF